jgi:hypothetical protein
VLASIVEDGGTSLGPHCAADLQLNSLPTVSLKAEFDIHASCCFARASCPPLRLGSLRAYRLDGRTGTTIGCSWMLFFLTPPVSRLPPVPALRLLACAVAAGPRSAVLRLLAPRLGLLLRSSVLVLPYTLHLAAYTLLPPLRAKAFGCHPGTAAIKMGERPVRPAFGPWCCLLGASQSSLAAPILQCSNGNCQLFFCCPTEP